jgi:hypothetical protein
MTENNNSNIKYFILVLLKIIYIKITCPNKAQLPYPNKT